MPENMSVRCEPVIVVLWVMERQAIREELSGHKWD